MVLLSLLSRWFARPRPLRVPLGPSPWAFRNRSAASGGITYHFVETAPGDSELGGMTSLVDPRGATLLVLNFYCYLRLLADGSALLWRESGDQAQRRVVFDCFRLASLVPVPDPVSLAAVLHEKELGVAPLADSEHWELSPYLDAGVHPLAVPYDWSRFEETLVLADHADTTGQSKMARAILACDWCRRQVEVFPQDWFNTADYDFGYQWITRVARRSDGCIVGDGIRLGSFKLDQTNRQVKRWLESNPIDTISRPSGDTIAGRRRSRLR